MVAAAAAVAAVCTWPLLFDIVARRPELAVIAVVAGLPTEGVMVTEGASVASVRMGGSIVGKLPEDRDSELPVAGLDT